MILSLALQVYKLASNLLLEVCKVMPQQECLKILTGMLSNSTQHSCFGTDHALQTALKAAASLVSGLAQPQLEEVNILTLLPTALP
jgi:hypothetical protein